MINADFQTLVNRHLEQFFHGKIAAVSDWDPRLVQLIEQIQSVTMRGGDRLRPHMCSLGYQVSAQRELEPIMPLLLALELFHSFALIHDDIMDEGQFRRGGPTINAYFTKNLRNEKLANSLSLLAGDLCLSWVHELLSQLPIHNQSNEVKQLFSQMEEGVILGQTLDVWGMQKEPVASLQRMYEAKSGSYSVKKPLLMGAILGGASKTDLKILTAYGTDVGLAFQLKDDLLGVFGDKKLTGKSAQSDITEGKWTFLVALTMAKLKRFEQNKMSRILGNPQASLTDIGWVKQNIIARGVKMKVESWMQALVTQAKTLISKSTCINKKELANIADFVISRKI